MKYLYKILRMFFCPHKYSKLISTGKIVDQIGDKIGSFFNKECKYCGKVKVFNLTS